MTEFKEITEEQIQPIRDALANNLFIIEEVLSSREIYDKTFNTLYGYMIQAFEVKEIRESPIYFKFKKSDEVIHVLQIRRFIVNFIMWEAFLRLDAVDTMDEKCIVDCTKLTNRVIKEFLDDRVIIPHRKKVSNEKLCIILSDIITGLMQISNDFNMIMGMSISIETFMDVANRNPRYNEIIRTKIDENMQPIDIETNLEALRKEEIAILLKEDNLLRPMLVTGSGINVKQLGEFSINGGLIISSAA